MRTLMTAAGLWVLRKDRPPRVYQPRNRRACLGELIQIDGSDHRWFEARAPAKIPAALADQRQRPLRLAGRQLMVAHAPTLARHKARHAGRIVARHQPFAT